jgi:hypothetical protein
MHLPRFLRCVNRVVTNPIMDAFAWLVPRSPVHHVGRNSGRRYRSPVLAFPAAKGFVIPRTHGRDVVWAATGESAPLEGEAPRRGGLSAGDWASSDKAACRRAPAVE